MAKLSLKTGTTSKLLKIFIQDSSVTTGAGLTGLTNASASLTAYYIREGDASSTSMALQSATLGTWTTRGFIVVDGTNMKGLYEFGIPDAALAAGAKSVVVVMQGATNMVPLVLEIELTAVDNQDAVHFGITGIPNAAAGASGGLLISGSNSGTTTFGAVTCTGSFTISDGLLVARSSSNASAITATGNGTGSGIVATSGSGATGDGIQATAASTNGNGLKSTGLGTGHGLYSIGGTGGSGLFADAGTSSAQAGIYARGGTQGAIGFYAAGGSLGGIGMGVTAGGAGGAADGMQITANTTGKGINVVNGGITSNITGNLSGSVGSLTVNNDKTAYTLTNAGYAAVMTQQLTESYAAKGTVPTPAQLMLEVRALLAENGVSSTTVTTKKIDSSTTAHTYTLNDATNPTGITTTT